jgi:long-chain fatty acid transport protein
MKKVASWAAASCGLAGVALAGAPALGAGFALKEQSSSALGNAFAGATAEAGDISYMFFNPAGLTRHSGNQATAAISYIAPQSEPQDMEGSTIAGVPITGGDGGSDIGKDAPVPAFYGMLSISERLKFGLGINAPFGLETDYADGWVGRYHGLNSELKTININPNIAYRLTDGFSVGAGFQAQYAEASLSQAVDFGSIGAALGVPGSIPTQQDGKAKLEGDDWGYGFNLGIMLEPFETTRFGLAYRSEVAHELDGDIDFDADGAGIATVLRGATGRFVDSDVKASLTTPESISAGFYHELTPKWAVMGEVQWTMWESFDELRIRFENPAESDSVTEENWNNTVFGAIGVTYRPNSEWAFRAGAAYDESPIPDSTRTPRIPGNDRQWLAIGAHWLPMAGVALDAGYTHIFVDEADVDLSATDTGNTFRGNLSGSYDASIDIVSLQATVSF